MIKIRLIIIFSVCFSILISTKDAVSAQYENYEWGTPKKEAIQQVTDKGYKIIEYQTYQADSREAVVYNDRLSFMEASSGYEITVFLCFTPISKALYSVVIKSENEMLGKKLKPYLEKKYGKYKRKEDFLDEYIWTEGYIPSIILRYNNQSEIYYYSEQYYLHYLKEKKRLGERAAPETPSTRP